MDYPNDFPTKNKKRGLRRAKFQNICHNIEDRLHHIYHENRWFSDTDLHIRAKRLAETPKPCGCWMCRNPRRVFKGKEKITVQEKKAPTE